MFGKLLIILFFLIAIIFTFLSVFGGGKDLFIVGALLMCGAFLFKSMLKIKFLDN